LKKKCILIFLVDRGFDITYKSSDDVNIQIVKYGEYLYDHIIIFAPATKGNANLFVWFFCILKFLFLEFGGRLDAEILTQFVDAGGNVLVAGSNTIGK
jgi:oligosaccharyltransferase complex subunit beta